MGRVVNWTAKMVQELRTMRGAGEPLLLCAERIGVSYSTAVLKARALGLADRRNRGRLTGRLLAERTRDP